MEKQIRPEDVAPLLGLSAQTVRIQMQRGILPIGIVGGTEKRRTYTIVPEMLYKETGIKINGYEPERSAIIDYDRFAKAVVDELVRRVSA